MDLATSSALPIPLVAPDLLTATCAPDGTCLHVNEAWRSVFGAETFWDRLPEDDSRFARDYLTDAARGLLVTHQVFLVEQRDDEAPVPLLLHFLPIVLPEVAAGQFPVVITGEKLQEPVNWAAEQTRRRRTEMLGQMAMGVAHDFNNLLTTILGHTQLLRDDLDDEGTRGQLATIERAAADGAALVRKIQQYIRHEKRERYEPVALDSLLEEVLTLTRPYWYNEPRRQGIAIELECDLQPLPPISGFPTELREVFVNLILNAVQAMPGGGTLALRTYHDPGAGCIVEIEDTGVGMPERVRSRVFEPLFTTKGESGTGMGLTVSYGIVHEHKGQIAVESEPGQGTRFMLAFPQASGEAPASDAGATSRTAATRALHILVVDDEDMVRSITARLLRLKGHTVDEAASGPKALEMIRSNDCYDLILTDLSMPEMSGRELAAHICNDNPDQPVILLTGDTDTNGVMEHIRAVVQKPFKLDDLEATIQHVLSEAAAP